MNTELEAVREQLNETKKLWWLHDSYWHATVVRELGEERANQLNLEANEKLFRKYTLMLLRSKKIRKPENIEELMAIFKIVWADAFFDELYVNEPITYKGNVAYWHGTTCHAYNSLSQARMTKNYACGCQAIRNGVMKALRLKLSHSIEKSLVRGDDECIIKITFEKK
jgi:hypothetical protein